MAGPAAVLAAKAALALATDKRAWKAVAVIIAAALTPFILVVVCMLGIASGTANHNNAALQSIFQGGSIPITMPAEYKTFITEMRACFTSLEDAVAEIGQEYEWEDENGNAAELDLLRVKAVFYVLYCSDGNLSQRRSEARSFVECFIIYSTNTRPCDDDCDDEDCEEYDIAIPITDLPTVYTNVGSQIGRALTPEDMVNINEIYFRVVHGDFSADSGNVSMEGGSNGTHALIAELTAGDDSPALTGGYLSPIDGDWRSLVSCEYGTGYAGHTGMDIAVPTGTPVYAVADGTVLFTRASSGGYGIHVAINHGGGGSPSGSVVTLYAHNSRLLVGEGQRVSQGEMIALSGDTGRSTGPHLHVEFVIGGQHQNPRSYLP